jgi:hypothetical protein
MRRKLLVLAVIALAAMAVGAISVESVSAATSADTSAVNWALAQVGHTEYEGVPWVDRCLPFVQDAYTEGASPSIPLPSISSPTGGWNANTDPEDVWSGTFSAGTTGGSFTTPPYGALVFFDAKPGYNPEDFSHVEIMGSNGEMIGTPGTPGQAVFEETLTQHEAARDYNTYVGWWLPDGVMGSPSAGTQLAELKGSDTVSGDNFGASVAVSGTTAVVGAWGHARFAGRAYVFTKTDAGWNQTAELTGSDTVADDQFGWSVAILGATAIVGAPQHANEVGAAYVFTKTTTGWKQVTELKGPDTPPYGFGSSVAISGTTAIVGVAGATEYSGRVYVFTKTAGGWTQTAELKGSESVAGDCFGTSVAISGMTALVGAEYGRGAAYVFTKTVTGWKQTAELNGVARDEFGRSVAISGTTAVVGAGAIDAYRVYLFTKTTNGWKQVAELKSSTVVNDSFGSSVAISGTTAVVGAPGANSEYPSGWAHVFTKTTNGWKQVAKLKASEAGLGDWFGGSVAISGTVIVVGADGQVKGAGRAYVFKV